MKQAALVISVIALVGVVVLSMRSAVVEPTPRAYAPLAPAAGGEEASEHGNEELEVAVVMGRMQRFHQKFWLALRADNAELAGFYLHEMEEAMEEIADAGIVEEGVDLSANMRTYGLGPVEHLEKLLKDQGVEAARTEASLLVNSCNSCHKASGYEMIRIKEPTDLTYPDQDFGPLQ